MKRWSSLRVRVQPMRERDSSFRGSASRSWWSNEDDRQLDWRRSTMKIAIKKEHHYEASKCKCRHRISKIGWRS